MLGSGTSQGVPVITCPCPVCQSENPKDKRLRSSIFIEDNGVHLVIDTGPDFRQQMLTMKATRLDAVLFTHAHKDHIAGLDEVRSFNFRQNEQIPIYCDAIVTERLKVEFAYCFEEVRYPGVPDIRIEQVEKDRPFLIKGISITPIEVLHYKLPVLGFRLGEFTYITDAKTISAEEKLKIDGSNYLIINGLQRQPHISHFTIDEVLEFIDSITPRPKMTWLTHISHVLGLHEEVEATLPDDVRLAFDGMELIVNKRDTPDSH